MKQTGLMPPSSSLDANALPHESLLGWKVGHLPVIPPSLGKIRRQTSHLYCKLAAPRFCRGGDRAGRAWTGRLTVLVIQFAHRHGHSGLILLQVSQGTLPQRDGD
jgi:hypothetical protein